MKEDNGFDLLTLNYYKTLKKPEPGNLSSVGVEKLSPQSEFQSVRTFCRTSPSFRVVDGNTMPDHEQTGTARTRSSSS